MFNQLLDRLFFEERFHNFVRKAGVNSLLEGNGVSEMLGYDPSYGQKHDVLKMRALYNELMPQALYWGKRYKKPSNAVAFNFVCDLLDAYIKKNPSTSQNVFTLNIELASMFCKKTIPPRWQEKQEKSPKPQSEASLVEKRNQEAEARWANRPDFAQAMVDGLRRATKDLPD